MPDEKLLEAVCCFPCLWQVSSKSYKHARARENIWKEVTEANIMTTIQSVSLRKPSTNQSRSGPLILIKVSEQKLNKSEHF